MHRKVAIPYRTTIRPFCARVKTTLCLLYPTLPYILQILDTHSLTLRIALLILRTRNLILSIRLSIHETLNSTRKILYSTPRTRLSIHRIVHLIQVTPQSEEQPLNPNRKAIIDSKGQSVGYYTDKSNGGYNLYDNSGNRIDTRIQIPEGCLMEGNNIGHVVPRKDGGLNLFNR